MGILDKLRWVVEPPSVEAAVYECVDCGSRIKSQDESCPDCGGRLNEIEETIILADYQFGDPLQ